MFGTVECWDAIVVVTAAGLASAVVVAVVAGAGVQQRGG